MQSWQMNQGDWLNTTIAERKTITDLWQCEDAISEIACEKAEQSELSWFVYAE